MDETFQIAINDQKIYVYNGSEYEEVLTSVFYETNKIWLSDDEDRIIVLSSRQILEDVAYQFFIRYFILEGSTWSEIDINIRDSSYRSVPIIEVSPDFLIVAVYYIDATDEVQIAFKHIN